MFTLDGLFFKIPFLLISLVIPLSGKMACMTFDLDCIEIHLPRLLNAEFFVKVPYIFENNLYFLLQSSWSLIKFGDGVNQRH